jgi:hypothetical protein
VLVGASDPPEPAGKDAVRTLNKFLNTLLRSGLNARVELTGLCSLPKMFNLSANHLLLLSRTKYRTCVVFLMQDHSTRRVNRLYDFTKSQQITPGQYYCVSGKVSSADKL